MLFLMPNQQCQSTEGKSQEQDRQKLDSSALESQDSRSVSPDHAHTHTHTHLTALFLGLPRWAGTRKVKLSWILLKQGTVSGSGISWAICKSAPHSRQITMPAPHHSVFYRPYALPVAQPTASKHSLITRKFSSKLCTKNLLTKMR